MLPLHEVLSVRRDEVLDRWQRMVQGTLTPEAMSSVELVDHLPLFLREVIAALRADVGLTSEASSPEDSETAAGHGEQRLRLGFSLDAVVREYGALREAILATGATAGASMSFRELQIVFDTTISGIAQAVTQYAQQRDLEMQRQHSEHFAFIAHELRNPLAAATMALEQLKRRGQLDAAVREVGMLGRGLQRTLELIDTSLNVARIASGIELRTERVRLKAVLEDAEQFAASEADEKQIKLHVDVQRDDDVHLDLRLVRSALQNLVRNAVKYSVPGATVELRGDVSRTLATIEIEDCCGGLAPGQVERAFAPFVRMSTTEPGFGLGLAIAKQAADAHGGAIRVQNLPGKGCIFALEFPLAGGLVGV